jgi:hypothetical protein
METGNGRYPLHSVISEILDQTFAMTPTQCYVVQLLLHYYPEAMFLEHTEEINRLRLLTCESSSSFTGSSSDVSFISSNRSSLYANDQLNDNTEEDEFCDVVITIDNEQYKVENELYKWIPIERIQQSENHQLKYLFQVYLDQFSKRYMVSSRSPVTRRGRFF